MKNDKPKLFDRVLWIFGICFIAQSLSSGLRAEPPDPKGNPGFGARKAFFEIRGGAGRNYGGSPLNEIQSANDRVLPVYSDGPDPLDPVTLQYGTTDEKLLNHVSSSSVPESKFRSRLIEFLFEYSAKERWGLGFSLAHEEYDVKHLSLSRAYLNQIYILNAMAGNPLNYTYAMYLQSLQYSPFLKVRESQILRINMADFTVAYHFLSDSNLDPYARILLGFGNADHFTKDNVTRLGLSLGLRYFVTDHVYSVVELNGSRFGSIYKNRYWYMNRIAASLGVGYSF